MTLFVPRPSGGPVSPAATHRALHLRQLYTILHLCLLRGDHARARAAWSVLIGCREMDWEDLWRLGFGINAVVDDGDDDDDQPARGSATEQQKEVDRRNGDYVEGLMRGGGRMSIPLLQQHVNHLLSLRPAQPEQALERLEIFLPGLPFAQNPTLHALAGMCALMLSVQDRSLGAPPNLALHRQALTYLQKAISLLSVTTASTQGNQTSPPENRTFYTSLLQLAQDSARWGDDERLEQREEREGGGLHRKPDRGGASSSASPPPSGSSDGGRRRTYYDSDSDGETVVDGGGHDRRRVKREQLEREQSLSSDQFEGSRQGSLHLDSSSAQASGAEDTGMADSEAPSKAGLGADVVGEEGDEDDDGAYDMDED